MKLFNEQINNWDEWGKVFQSISAFAPLIEHIFHKEKLLLSKIENLTPGTNAVFRTGEYVVKIFAPPESGIDQSLDLQTELFAAKRANEIGVSAPKVIADGVVADKYRFSYIITEYIQSVELVEAVKTMTDVQKILLGRKLREITDKMNMPCEAFNGIDVINDKGRYKRWERYPETFKAERLAYIQTHDFGGKVFCHGDLCFDNILLTPQNEIYIIDFADAVLAPVIYEHSHIACTTLLDEWQPMLAKGYFGEYKSEEFIEMCFNGLLIHDFGGDIVKTCICEPGEVRSLDNLRNNLKQKLTNRN